MAIWTIIFASWLAWAHPTPTPNPTPPPLGALAVMPTPAPTPKPPLFMPPEVPALSPAGENLVIEFEVGGRSGYKQHPELPDRLRSGVTWGIGYDGHQNTPGAIVADFSALAAPAPVRLAATHPFYGQNAVEPWHKVQDIVVSWQVAIGVFNEIDVAREWARAERAMPGFGSLRPNAQAALISLGFNRGWSMTGDNRREMRAIRDAVPSRNYATIAAQLRQMERVWRGTSIYHGMLRRRNAEAALVETP
jgi:hypothetical protein